LQGISFAQFVLFQQLADKNFECPSGTAGTMKAGNILKQKFITAILGWSSANF